LAFGTINEYLKGIKKGRTTMSMEPVKTIFNFNEVMMFLNFNEVDKLRLKKIYPTIRPLIPKIVKLVIKRVTDNPKLVGVLKSHTVTVEAVQSIFENWLNQVFSSDYDTAYAEFAYKIAMVHEKSGIHPKYVIMTMSIFIMVIDYVISRMIADRKTIFAYQHSIKKALFLNMIMTSQSYDDVKRDKILKSLEYL
jgi:hypothetical protein